MFLDALMMGFLVTKNYMTYINVFIRDVVTNRKSTHFVIFIIYTKDVTSKETLYKFSVTIFFVIFLLQIFVIFYTDYSRNGSCF